MPATLGWAIAGLGPRILRTETASLAALTIIEATFGDLVAALWWCLIRETPPA